MNKQIISFINTLKNISISNKKEVLIPYNSLVLNYIDCLYHEGFLQSYEILIDLNQIKIYTRSINGKVITSDIKFISTLTKKKYLSSFLIKQIKVKNKEYILSTNIGILSLSECQRQNVGGLVVFSC